MRSPIFVRRWTLSVPSRTKVGSIVLGVALAACSSGPSVEPPKPGDALAPIAAGPVEVRLPPRQELVVLVRPFESSSDEPLEITKLRAIPGEGIPDAVQIVQTSIVAGGTTAPGMYVTFPPVTKAAGRCVRADVRAPRGVTLGRDDDPLILVWLRALTEGAATVEGLRVTYEQGGTLFEQELSSAELAHVTVDLEAPARRPSRDERACAHRTRVLPGAVTY